VERPEGAGHFQRLDHIVCKFPCSSRYHKPYAKEDRFSAQLVDILDNRQSYRLASHPVFRYFDDRTADHFSTFCREPEAWQRFLHDRGTRNPIVGPDAGFYRAAAYQCSKLLPTPRAIRRLVESVYAARYCDRESSDGQYGGSELVELPYRYQSESEHTTAVEEAVRIEVVSTEASATVTMQPGIATVLERTRATPESKSVRRIIEALSKDAESSLLAEARFRNAWRAMCTVYAENAAMRFSPSRSADHRVATFSALVYVLARLCGVLVLPAGGIGHEPDVAKDWATIASIEKFGPRMLRGFRALVKIPALREQMEKSTGVRCSTVPLTVRGASSIDLADACPARSSRPPRVDRTP
jgi:hypothetical protein|tara:strand:+ start:350 stop:1417 length:1068 start_codon:yes stop_codon:yes gene_type:complete